MSKTEIINTIARQRMVEKIVKRYDIEYRDDLSQMIYLWLLEKPDELIQQLWENKQINYYVARMVSTQVKSVSSKYYVDYVYRGVSLNEALEVPNPEKYTLLGELIDKIDSLSNEERDMLYNTLEKDENETAAVANKIGCNSMWEYRKRLKKLKYRICDELGGDTKQLEKYYSKRKKVCLIDSQQHKLIFSSINEAAKFLGYDPSVVRKYCGQRVYHKGYYFKYLYD